MLLDQFIKTSLTKPHTLFLCQSCFILDESLFHLCLSTSDSLTDQILFINLYIFCKMTASPETRLQQLFIFIDKSDFWKGAVCQNLLAALLSNNTLRLSSSWWTGLHQSTSTTLMNLLLLGTKKCHKFVGSSFSNVLMVWNGISMFWTKTNKTK